MVEFVMENMSNRSKKVQVEASRRLLCAVPREFYLQDCSNSISTEESTQSPHTIFKRLLCSVLETISEIQSPTLSKMSLGNSYATRERMSARPDSSALRVRGRRAIAGCAKGLLLAAPKGYCWLRQRAIAGCAKGLTGRYSLNLHKIHVFARNPCFGKKY